MAGVRGKIKGVLEAAVHVCETKAAARDITLELTCPDDLRTRINAPLLEQAVVNLIDNAIKFSPPRQPGWGGRPAPGRRDLD